MKSGREPFSHFLGPVRNLQTFQEIDGTMSVKGKRMPVSDASLGGESLSFSSTVGMKGQEVIMRYHGRINGDSIQGRVDIQEGPFAGNYDWTAARSKKVKNLRPKRSFRKLG